MIVYHSTTAETAKKIIEHGFHDGRGRFLTASEWVGVWVSDRPLDQNEGAKGDTVLQVNLTVSEEEIAQYEWVQEGAQLSRVADAFGIAQFRRGAIGYRRQRRIYVKVMQKGIQSTCRY
jgi:hypothetical protein